MRCPAACFILTVLVLACSKGKTRDTHTPLLSGGRPVLSVLLKFQDSTGFTVRSLPVDSLGASLRKLVESVGGIPSGPRDTGSEYDARGVGLCMCSTSYDSLILEFSDGTRQAYLFACSAAYRESPKASLPLHLEELENRKMNIRWDKVRARYCPKGYGCSDGSSPTPDWEVLDETWFDGKWMPYASGRMVGDTLKRMIQERNLPFRDFGIRLSVRVEAEKVKEVHLDSVDPSLQELAEELARRVMGSPRTYTRDMTFSYRLRAFNLSDEN